MIITRRGLMQAGAGLAATGFGLRAAYAELPKLAKKDAYKVGFAQTESVALVVAP